MRYLFLRKQYPKRHQLAQGTRYTSKCPSEKNIIYDNASEFKLHFEAHCDTYDIKHKPTNVKNPTKNAILEYMHQVTMVMLCAELGMTNTVVPVTLTHS